MPLPNLILAGAQKSGTTWLHETLAKSDAIFAVQEKELAHFNRADFADPDRLAAYEANFPDDLDVTYHLESTPHYFRVPKDNGVDTARNIHEVLDDPTILVILRNPVDRYESAYIHHMMRGRRPYTAHIEEVSDFHGLLTLGCYATTLEHWQRYFDDIIVMVHDDLIADRQRMFDNLMARLGLDNDVPNQRLMFRTNDKHTKVDRLGLAWEVMPSLTSSARRLLVDHYRPEVHRLQELINRDLSPWLEG